VCHAQPKKGDPKEDALRDMKIGMAGIQQAGDDPALLAQLMRDMQVCYIILFYLE
jgi:hypothetical protein